MELAKKREAAKAAAEARERQANRGWLSWCVVAVEACAQNACTFLPFLESACTVQRMRGPCFLLDGVMLC